MQGKDASRIFLFFIGCMAVWAFILPLPWLVTQAKCSLGAGSVVSEEARGMSSHTPRGSHAGVKYMHMQSTPIRLIYTLYCKKDN